MFVAQHGGSKIVVPQLYAAFHDEQTGHNFIIMEYIPGATLQSLWHELGQDGRQRVAQQLKPSLDALRQIPSPGYYGKLRAQPYDDIFLGAFSSSPSSPATTTMTATTTTTTSTSGPFPTEDAFHDALYRRYVSLHPAQAPGRGAFYRDCVFATVLPPRREPRDSSGGSSSHYPHDHSHSHPHPHPHPHPHARAVFTHGDLQAKNILLRAADGVPVLLDWECAGWYPSYWEYTNALWTSRRWDDDWFRFVGGAVEAHVLAFVCLENLLGDLLDRPPPGV